MDSVKRLNVWLAVVAVVIVGMAAVGCGGGGKDAAQTSAWDENGGSAENIDALQYGGVYKFGDDPAEARGGAAYIYPKNENTLLFNLFVWKLLLHKISNKNFAGWS